MSWITGARTRLRHLLRRAGADARMNAEMRFHIEMETEKNVRAGMPAAEARRRAALVFGSAETQREVMREARRLPVLEDVWRDVRYAARSLSRTPGFAVAAMLTLALGIAATTVMFTALNGILLRPLPVLAPERLASFRPVLENGQVRASVTAPAYAAYRSVSAGAFAGLAAHHLSDVTVATSDVAEVALGMDVSGNYFDVLGVQPALGRFFAAERAEQVDAESVVVISHDFWRTRFGGTASVLGRTIYVNGQALTIAGVTPRGFHGAMIGARPVLWVPLGLGARLQGREATDRGWHWLQLFGRLRDDTNHEQAQVAMGVAARQLAGNDAFGERQRPADARIGRFSAVPASGQRSIASFLFLLLATGAVVLLIAIVNVAGMLLARSSARRREMGIRLALGAGRRRLVRQLLTESLLLAMLGGVGGVLLTIWASGYLTSIRPPFARFFQLDLPIDVRVLSFAVVVSLVTGVLFGLTPALYTAQRDVVTALKDGGAGAGRRSRLRSALVVGQLALSLLLLVSAGLFVRTVQSALRTDHGFDPHGVLALEMNLRLNGYDEERGRTFYERLLERVRATPGAEAAALATVIPLGFSWDETLVRVPGHEPPQGTRGFSVGYNLISPGYFATMRMPLTHGRDFTAADAGGPARIIINHAFAQRFWPGRSPIGQTIRYSGADAEIIGVVPDGKYESLTEEPRLFTYGLFGANYAHETWLHVRTRGNPAEAMAAIRREIAALDPHVPPIVVTTVASVMGSSLFPQRLAAGMVGTFGTVGLILAAIGLFGLLSFAVAERTRELGVRMALGATRAQVLGLVLLGGMRLLGAGILIGLLCAAGATQLLRGLLHGLSPLDPLTYTAVPLLLLLICLLAAALPARRASRVDPVVALRAE